MKLSIIDQSPVSEGFTPADALANTIELARLADRLGYERYWIAEHHDTPAFASPAPEILIARVAAETEKIRVGSGGVMLPHYSPLKVAESFRMLHALYPGRIDLGLGRAPGGSPLDTFALRRERSEVPPADDFPNQLMELLAFLHRGFRSDHPFNRITVTPDMPGAPEVWLLGSSPWSSAAASQVGLPYAFAHFIDPHPTRTAIEYYRAHFKPSSLLSEPRAILALSALCAETEAEAERLITSARLMRQRFRQGKRGAVPSLETAAAELSSAARTNPDSSEFPRAFVGTPERVRSGLTAMAEQLAVDELMVVTITHSHRARMRSYELLADAFELAPRA